MATLTITYTFSGGGNAVASEVNTNFTDIRNWVNAEPLQRDGSIAATGHLTLGAGDPTAAGHAARKAYVDAQVAAISNAIDLGVPKPFLGSVLPANHIWCKGQTIAGADVSYPALWAVLDSAWKSGTSFLVPDLRGRVVAGGDVIGDSGDAGRLDWANTMGTTGGEQKHTMTTAEMVQHTHTVNDPTHSHGILSDVTGSGSNDVAREGNAWNSSFTTAAAATGITINNAGSTTPFNVMQPTITMNWILRVA